MTTQSEEETVAFPRSTFDGEASVAQQAAQEAAQDEPAADEDDNDLLDENEWDRPPRTSRLTWILVGGLVAALAFAGGVVVQKAHDASLVGTGARATRAAGTGFGAGTGGAGTGGAGTGGAGTGGAAAAGNGGAGTGTPVAVGTVTSISGTTLTITNFGGKTITVNVPPTATVTTKGLGGLTHGAPVSVEGTANPDGSVTATSITSRSSGG